MKTLLPSHHTVLLRALERAIAPKVDPDIIRASASIAETDPKFLPYIAYQKAIGRDEGWVYAESDQGKRDLLHNAWEIHRYKGTPHAIRVLFRSLGIGEIEILENVGYLRYDGTKKHDGTYIYGGDINSTWATYKIKLSQAITIDQAELVRGIIDFIAPARSQLISLDYQIAALRYNGQKLYDGQYSHGEA